MTGMPSWNALTAGDPHTAEAPVLCSRCRQHAGRPGTHWCIGVAFPGGGRAVDCQCPCERRRANA